MPFAGQTHVIVAVQPAFNGLAVTRCGDRSERRPLAGLALLAAKASTHAPHFYCDRVGRLVQNFRQVLLDFAWMLGRAVNEHIAVFLRHRE